jgi:hypothetical protein
MTSDRFPVWFILPMVSGASFMLALVVDATFTWNALA